MSSSRRSPPTTSRGTSSCRPSRRATTLGLAERPLGPARFDSVCSADVYRAILEQRPYPVRGLVSFGSNLVLSHADVATATKALQALDFHVRVDLFMNPSARFSDVVLPATTPFESEGLKVGFEISEAACGHVQLRRPLVPPIGEARPDTEIIFDLACRMGLGDRFWNGDIDAGYSALLAPSGVTLEALRAAPEGIRVPLETRYRKFAEVVNGAPRGFNTPSRRIEFYSERLLDHGYPPLPDNEAPLVSHSAEPRLAPRYPLTLTCTKDALYCESQHRGLPSLRRRAPDPQVDIHPRAAAARNIAAGDWVRIETPPTARRGRGRASTPRSPRTSSADSMAGGRLLAPRSALRAIRLSGRKRRTSTS